MEKTGVQINEKEGRMVKLPYQVIRSFCVVRQIGQGEYSVQRIPSLNSLE